MTHHWLYVSYIHMHLPDSEGWQATALRSDGYDFYGNGSTQEESRANLDKHLNRPAPQYSPAPPEVLARDWSHLDGLVTEVA